MKRIIYTVIYCLSALNFAQAKKLPEFVQHRLDSMKKEIQKSLTYYRVWDNKLNGYKILPSGLGFYTPYSIGIFSYEETNLIDSLGLNVNIGMVYDNEMRNRIVQLMRNEYQEWELDSLVNISINRNLSVYDWQAFEIGKIDTLTIFRKAMDSLYLSLETKNSLDMFKKLNKIYDYEIFKLLQLDTTSIYKQIRDKVVDKEEKKERQDLLNNTNNIDTDLAELCGHIGDRRFIQPLIEMLNRTEEDYQRKKIIEALARMRAEPYYSDYVKNRTLSPVQINDSKWLDFKIQDFVYVLGTQEAFLELSKYLLSDKPNSSDIMDYADHSEIVYIPVSEDTFYIIRDNIENREVQEITGKEYIEDTTPLLKPLYDWMQKNYGKYKIRRLW